MPRSVDAAIRMSHNIKILNQVVSDPFEKLPKIHAAKVFSDSVVDYLNQLSKTLFKDVRTKAYPDVGTFAFYCRSGNIRALKKKSDYVNAFRLGRGLIFHVAPSNVPVNFAYSLLAGLLSGNNNIVRLPSKNFEQVQIIIDAIDFLATQEKFQSVSNGIVLIQYDNTDDSISEYLSAICNVRIIWGGDETINNVRKYALSPRAFDLTFSDRYSICVLNADTFVNEEKPRVIASGFYNDTYLFDQNACTSPHLVVWLGCVENVRKAQNIFWGELHKLVKEQYSIQAVQAVDKMTAAYDQALGMADIRLISTEDNLLWRVKLSSLEKDIENFRCSSGYFSEYHASSLDDLVPVINSKYQTMAYYGFDRVDLEDFISMERPTGIDRIVPIGRTTEFSLVWDGYDLINTLSRTVEIT